MFEWFLIALMILLVSFVGWMLGKLCDDDKMEEFCGWVATLACLAAGVLSVLAL